MDAEERRLRATGLAVRDCQRPGQDSRFPRRLNQVVSIVNHQLDRYRMTYQIVECSQSRSIVPTSQHGADAGDDRLQGDAVVATLGNDDVRIAL